MRIAVVGAYGFTGKLICEELQRRGIAFLVSGRNEHFLQEVFNRFSCAEKMIVADVKEKKGIDEILSNSDLIINCAGPYTEEGEVFINEIVVKGKHYLDLSGELEFVRDSQIKWGELAQETGAIIMQGCAFESLPAGLLFNEMAKSLGSLRSVNSFYHFSRYFTSPGTRLTMKLAKFRNALKIENQTWEKFDPLNDQLNITWQENPELTCAVPLPLSEIAYAHWDFKITNSGSYFLLAKADAATMDVRATGPTKEEILAKHKERKPVPPKKEYLDKQLCTIIVSAENGNGALKKMAIRGFNCYKISALCAVMTAIEISNNQGIKGGVVSPAKAFQGREIEVLKTLGFELIPAENFSFK